MKRFLPIPSLLALLIAAPVSAAPAGKCDLKGDIEKAREELQQVTGRADSMRKKLLACHENGERLRRQLEDLKKKDAETLAELAGALAEAERRAGELERARAGLEKEKAKLEGRVAALDKANGRSTELLAESGKRIAVLERATADMKQHLAKSAENMEGELAAGRILAKREMEKLHRASEAATAEVAELKLALSASQAEKERALAESRVAAKRQMANHLAAAEAAEKARAEALEKLAAAEKRPKADPEVLRVAMAAKLAAETELANVTRKADGLAGKLREATKATEKVRADLVAEQVVRARLQTRVEEAEAKLAKATAKPAPPEIVRPAGKVGEAAPVALAILRFENNAGETARDRDTLLGQVKTILGDRPGAEFDIIGHTCNTGDAGANQSLSVRRATGVRDMLVRGGIPADKLRASGSGQTNPVADNATLAGRRLNRRVEVHLRD